MQWRIDCLSLVWRKPVFGVSDQARLKFGCATALDGERPEISDLECRELFITTSTL